MSQEIRCHFDVLGVSRDADAATIKKAHRKLALRWHPDKNAGCKEAEHEFRLVQQAYECLSDPAERKWYEEHRESILRGGKGFDDGDGGGGDAGGVSFIFDVIPFQYAGCYDGYGDGDGDFFAVYSNVFREVMEGEKAGWISEGNIDEARMPNAHLFSVDFGDSTSGWSDVTAFYGSWESFSSCLSFAWADQYDPRDAPNRRVRRAIDDENRKARRAAKRERNDDVLNLVRFVKRRDPRVKAAKERMELERAEREAEVKKENQRKKAEAALAREVWREEAAKAMAEAEANDLEAGRIRLADLDDDEHHFFGDKKGRKKKKGKKGKKKRQSYDDDNCKGADQANGVRPQEDGNQPVSENLSDANQPADNNVAGEGHADSVATDSGNGPLEAQIEIEREASTPQLADGGAEKDFAAEEGKSEEDEEEEPEFWRCECCRKDFKSEGQMHNHMKSKKHKEAWKKYEKKKLKEAKEQAVMEELLDEMAL